MFVYISVIEVIDGEFEYAAHRSKSGALAWLKREVASNLYGSIDARDVGLAPMDLSELRENYGSRTNDFILDIREANLED